VPTIEPSLSSTGEKFHPATKRIARAKSLASYSLKTTKRFKRYKKTGKSLRKKLLRQRSSPNKNYFKTGLEMNIEY
jgi:hypothetical protein